MVARLPAYPPTRGARRPRRAIHLPGVPPRARAYPAGAPISSRRNGGKEGPGGFPPFQKGGFAWIFIEGAPGAFDPGPPVRGLLAAVGCTDRAKTSRALPPAPLAGACGNWGPRRSPAKRVRWGEFPGEAPPVADKASRKKGAARLAGRFGPVIALPRREQGSGGNELSGLPESERSVAWADDAAPWVARIAVTLQALGAGALYQLGPPGRRRCLASEKLWRLW